jgi:hypothetical protein
MKLEGQNEGVWVADVLDGSFAKVLKEWDCPAGIHFTNEDLDAFIELVAQNNKHEICLWGLAVALCGRLGFKK